MLRRPTVLDESEPTETLEGVMRKLVRKTAALGALVAVVACSDPTDTRQDSAASFSLQSTGSEVVELRGTVFVMPKQSSAYGEYDARSGAFVYSDVTPLMLTRSSPFDLSGPVLSVGLLGDLHEGRYSVGPVRGPGDSTARIYAELIVPEDGGVSRHFLIDEGELVISEVRPMLRGTLALRGSKMVRLPTNASVGASAEAMAGPIVVTGEIGKGGER